MMDTRIALAGTPIDFAGSMTNGLQAGMMQRQAQQQNALAQLYQTQGPQIMAGNPQALNALAQMDPNAALGVQQSVLGVQTSQFQLQQVKDQAREHAAAVAAKMTADQAAAESAKLGTILQGAAAAPDEATYNGWLMQNGVNPADHPFAQRDMWVAAGLGAKDALDIQSKRAALTATPDPTKDAPTGTMWNDPNNHALGVKPLPGYIKPGPQTVIDMGGGTDKQVYDSMQGSFDAASGALTGLNSITNAQTALSGAITGFGADQRLALAKVATYFGADPSAVTDTETFRAAIAPQVAATMKATVGSTQISDADRKFAEQASGGSIALDQTSIARLLDIMKRADEVIIAKHQAKLDKVYPDTPDGKYARERALFGLDVPAPIDPSGGDQLSPEAQKLLEQWQ